jgi:hypothetical protein
MKNENKLNDLDSIKAIIANVEQSNLMKKAPLIIAKHLFTGNILKEIDEYKILFQQVILYRKSSSTLFFFSISTSYVKTNKKFKNIYYTLSKS